MEELNLLPNTRRPLAIFRGHPFATCCVDCGEDSNDMAKEAANPGVKSLPVLPVRTNPHPRVSSKVVTNIGTAKVDSGDVQHQEKVPDLQFEVDHDHSDSSSSEEDLTVAGNHHHHHHHGGNVLTEKTIRAYDLSSVLIQLAQFLFSMAFMESWLGGKARTMNGSKKNSSPSVVKKQEYGDDDVEPIPQIPY